MTRAGTTRLLAGLSAAAFLLSAALLVSSYGSIVTSAQRAPADIATLIPALWLAFAVAMIVFGVIMAATTRRDGLNPRLTLFLVALFPTATGMYFVRFLGFMRAPLFSSSLLASRLPPQRCAEAKSRTRPLRPPKYEQLATSNSTTLPTTSTDRR